jgi:hypothetical protein
MIYLIALEIKHIMIQDDFIKKWLKHIKKPNYSQKKINEMKNDLHALAINYIRYGQIHTPR